MVIVYRCGSESRFLSPLALVNDSQLMKIFSTILSLLMKMHIAYLVNNVEDLTGGLRVIIEHVNQLKALGNKVEIWNQSGIGVSYFESQAVVKLYDPSKLNVPDVVVITELGFLPDVIRHRTKPATYLLLQHDNEWVSEVVNASTYASLMKDNVAYFQNGNCKILVVSSWLQRMVKEKYDVDSVLIMNGVDHDLFRPTTPLLHYKAPSVLLFYDPQIWKGFYEAVRAIIELRKKVPNLEVLIIGKYLLDPPKVDGVAFAFPFPIALFNRPPQQNLASIISSARIHLSTSWKEGFGLPGLEAMACGVPQVSSNALGNEDYAVHNKTALIVTKNTPQAYAESMLQLLTDATLYRRLRDNGLKRAKEFSWPKSIEKLERLMKKDLSS